MGRCVAHKTWVVHSSKVKVTHKGQLKIHVRSVTFTRIEVYLYNFSQMFFKVRRCVAHKLESAAQRSRSHRGQLKIHVRSVTVTRIEVNITNFAQMFFKVRRNVAHKLGFAAQRSRSHLGVS